MVPATAPDRALAEDLPVAFEGDSQLTWFEGSFGAYGDRRDELLAAEVDRPRRITRKRLTRG